MDYGFEHAGKVFTPNATEGVSPENNAERNKALERAELEEWRGKPERFAGYISKTGRFTTWLGTDLGQVFVNSEWKQVSPNARYVARYTMRSITVKGNNGATYYGRYSSDWSQLCRVRRAK